MIILYKNKSFFLNNNIAIKSLFLILTVLFLTIISIITFISLNNLEQREKQKTKQSLEFILKGTNNTLNLWIDSKYEILNYLTENYFIKEEIIGLLNNTDVAINKKIIDKKLLEFKSITKSNDNNFSILSKEFDTLYSFDNTTIKASVFDFIKTELLNSKKEYFVLPPRQNSHYYIYIIKPILKDAEVLGYSILGLNPYKEFIKIVEQGRFGNTGETYALNSSAQMLSNTRFIQDIKDNNLLLDPHNVVLNLEIKDIKTGEPTHMVRNVLQKKKGHNLEGYYDYRGKIVLGTWLWNDKFNIALASEVDRKEAIGTFESMKRTIIIIVFSVMLFSLLLIYLIVYLGNKSKKKINQKNKELNKLLESLELKVEDRTKEIQKQKKQITDSIEYASLIQKALIPEEKNLNKYFEDSFVIWNPRDVVGGDIYLFEEIKENEECILMVIDCTGHGVPGAFVTMLVKAIERQIISNIINKQLECSPSEILTYFNKTMKELLKQHNTNSISNAGFDGAVLYYNKKTRTIKFAGAKTPLLILKEEDIEVINADRHSIGYIKSNPNYEFKEHEFSLNKNDQIYLSTDGFYDQNGGEKGLPFGKRKFKEILKKEKNNPLNIQKEELINCLQEHMMFEDKNDDITVIGLKI